MSKDLKTVVYQPQADNALVDFDEWFSKPSWDSWEASAILAGLNPLVVTDPNTKLAYDFDCLAHPITEQLWRYTEDVHLDWHELVQTNFEDFRCHYAASMLDEIIYNPDNEELFYDSVRFRPMDLIQWCVDHHVSLHYSLKEYLQKIGYDFRFSENSEILFDYKIYGRQDIWRMPIAARMVLGHGPNALTKGLKARRNIARNYEPNYTMTAYDEIYYIMELAMQSWKTGNLDFVSVVPEDPEDGYYDEENCGVEVDSKKFVNWAINKGFTPPVQLLEIMGLKPPEIARPLFPSGSYISPYMALMSQAIQALRITNENQPAKQAIVEWLKAKDPSLSGREVDYLATFIRTPEMKKGGYYKGNTEG